MLWNLISNYEGEKEKERERERERERALFITIHCIVIGHVCPPTLYLITQVEFNAIHNLFKNSNKSVYAIE